MTERKTLRIGGGSQEVQRYPTHRDYDISSYGERTVLAHQFTARTVRGASSDTEATRIACDRRCGSLCRVATSAALASLPLLAGCSGVGSNYCPTLRRSLSKAELSGRVLQGLANRATKDDRLPNDIQQSYDSRADKDRPDHGLLFFERYAAAHPLCCQIVRNLDDWYGRHTWLDDQPPPPLVSGSRPIGTIYILAGIYRGRYPTSHRNVLLS